MQLNFNRIFNHWDTINTWTNVYGLARSLIALGSFITLLFNDSTILFKPSAGVDVYPSCVSGYSLFCIFQNNYFYLEIIRYICLFILFLVIIGWRPKLTAIPHWIIVYSLQNSLTVIDGGDQAAAVITFLLIPIALTDNRKWHWAKSYESNLQKKIIANISFFIIRVQVAILYFHSTIAKLGTREWIDGTAVYYFVNDHLIGFNSFFKFLFESFVQSPLIFIPTWGTLIVQTIIFGALFAPKRFWKPIFIIAILMHEIFALMLGLVSFSIIMSGLLVLYLIPKEKDIDIKRFLKYNKITNFGKNSNKKEEVEFEKNFKEVNYNVNS